MDDSEKSHAENQRCKIAILKIAMYKMKLYPDKASEISAAAFKDMKDLSNDKS